MRRILSAIVAGLALLVCMVLVGCEKPAVPASTAPNVAPAGAAPHDGPPLDASDKYAAAKNLFQTQCSRCHALTETAAAGPRGGKGPNLSKIGAKHPRGWIADHIRDPQNHKQGSRMPKFAGKMKDDDLGKLADYLASLR